MRGLRSLESKEFEAFFNQVQLKSLERGTVFFLDTGDCNDVPFKDMILDDICGWEIPFNQVEEFEKQFLSHKDLDKWSDFFTWVIPKVEKDELKIEFKQFS